MDYQSLTQKYPRFDYNGYYIYKTETEVKIEYSFCIEGLSQFNPCWIISQHNTFANKDDSVIHNLAFHLGLVELVSYWKTTCSPHVYIYAGVLSNAQIDWWKKLYFYGLGEFFYINSIETTIDKFMTIHIDDNAPVINAMGNAPILLDGNLIPVGGGKDSIVTLDLLKDYRNKNSCYMMNKTKARMYTAVTAGYTDNQIIIANRTLDQNMLRLNKQGFLNGHTPLSALVAFSSLLIAYLYGKRYIILSNESSANDYTITEAEVNHQYSKSYQFESDFNQYISKYLDYGIQYFSLLRPFCELQISDYFAKLSDFHYGFNSCNLGSKTDTWCLNCPKCLFVYIILSPFLTSDALERIFGVNLLNDPKFIDDFQQLTGFQPNKPFECVGSREEVNIAVNIAITKLKESNEEIPYLYKMYMKSPLFLSSTNNTTHYKSYWDTQHLIPKEFMTCVEKSRLHVNAEI